MVIQRLKDAAEKAKIELSSEQETTINLPFLTADASGPKHLQKKLTRAKLEQMIARLVERTMEPVQEGARGREEEAERHRRGRARRWLDAHPARAGDGQEVLRQRAAQGREPGRGRRDRRGRAGRRALRRREGHGPPRRHAALARRRDARRRDDGDDPAQHDDPDAEEGDLLDGEPTASRRSRSTCCRASAPRRATTARSAVPPRGHPAGAARRAEIEVTFDIDANGILSVAAKDMATGDEQDDQHHRVERPVRGATSRASSRRRDARGRGQDAPGGDRARNKLDTLSTARRSWSARTRRSSSDVDKLRSRSAQGRPRRRSRSNAIPARPDELRAAFEKLQSAAHSSPSRCTRQAGAGRRRRGARRRARRPADRAT